VYFEHYYHKSDSVIFRLRDLADEKDSNTFAKKLIKSRVALPAVVENITNVKWSATIDMKL